MADVVSVQNKLADRMDTGALALIGAKADAAAAVFLPKNFGELMEFAKLMACAYGAVPPHLRGKPSDCLAVAMQAMRWEMDPFAVAQKTFFVNDRIAYEAQLVVSVINTRANLDRNGLELEWAGAGEDMRCTVSGTFVGADRPKVFEAIMKTITTRNSPLWKQQPRVQLGYWAQRAWARLYCPEVLLGVYTPDELQQEVQVERAQDITPPRPTRAQFASAQPTAFTDVAVEEVDEQPERFDLIDEFGEVAREELAANAFLDVLEDRISKAGQPAALWEHNADAAERAAEMVENGDEILARIRQAAELKAEAVDWPAKVAELKAEAGECKSIDALVAFKAKHAAVLKAIPDDLFPDWNDFADALAGKLKGAK